MGGMLVVCYVLMYLQDLCSLLLVNLIGLEDWKVLGVFWCSVDVWYVGEMNISYDSICCYQLDVYYDGKWKLVYEFWVWMQLGMYEGFGKQVVVWSQVLVLDMVFNQLVVYELKNLQVLIMLFIGQKDCIVIGCDLVLFVVKVMLGNYLVFGKVVVVVIFSVMLVEFVELGYLLQVQDLKQFNVVLLKVLKVY